MFKIIFLLDDRIECNGGVFVFLAANIVIQTEPSVTSVSSNEVRYNSEQENRKRTLPSADGSQAKKPWMDR